MEQKLKLTSDTNGCIRITKMLMKLAEWQNVEACVARIDDEKHTITLEPIAHDD